jgi:hypothetical protein
LAAIRHYWRNGFGRWQIHALSSVGAGIAATLFKKANRQRTEFVILQTEIEPS